MTTFTVFGAPATKGSTVSFIGSKGQVVTKPDCKNLAAWSQAVGWAARAALVPLAPAGVPVGIEARFQFVRPKRASLRGWPTVKPDIDKVLRALLDALTGVGYVDDAQVVNVWVSKRYGDVTQMTVTIREM